MKSLFLLLQRFFSSSAHLMIFNVLRAFFRVGDSATKHVRKISNISCKNWKKSNSPSYRTSSARNFKVSVSQSCFRTNTNILFMIFLVGTKPTQLTQWVSIQEIGNIAHNSMGSQLVVNTRKELCGGFINQMNITLVNYTQQNPIHRSNSEAKM